MTPAGGRAPEVLIVGGGPVGLALSLALARLGVPSTILEARLDPTPARETRALTWMPRGIEFLEWLGVRRRVDAIATRRTAHEFWSSGRCRLSLDIAGVDSAYPYTLDVSQHDSEVILEQAVRETGMVDVRRGHEVSQVLATAEQVEVEVQAGARVYRLAGSYGIACDGYHSALRQQLGIDEKTFDYGADSAVADVVLRTPYPAGSSRIVLDAARPHGFFPFGERSLRLVYRLNPGESRADMTSEGRVRVLLASLLRGHDVERVLWASAFRLAQKQRTRYRAGRWLLAGDAAHAMGPSAGAGLQVGAMGAFRLAWRLARAINGDARWSQLFDDYDREQHEASRQTQTENALIFRNLAVRNRAVGFVRGGILSILGRFPRITSKMAATSTLVATALPVREASDRPRGRFRFLASVADLEEGHRVPARLLAKLLGSADTKVSDHAIVTLGPASSEQSALVEQMRVATGNRGAIVEGGGSDQPAVAVVRPDQEIVALAVGA
jgi:2-polyprenyl-6-methoxyphenol hydroxylase-like FAD-dependent oxidoreductase